MSAVVDPELLRRQVVDFQMREIALLQTGRYEEWLNCFADDLRYWMPIQYIADHRADGEAGLEDMAYYDDSLETLTLRVKRALSKVAWTELPFSRFRYFIQPLSVDQDASGVIHVASNILVYQTRLEREETWFVGGREDSLRVCEGQLRVFWRKIVIERTILPSKNLTVFF